jgi:hypothetical protein
MSERNINDVKTYYVERYYRGEWWYQNTEDGSFHKFSREMLLWKINNLIDTFSPFIDDWK